MADVRERWLSRRAVSLHFAVLVVRPWLCASRPGGRSTGRPDGNQLSYLYSVMWPAFGLLGIYFWWMLIHTDFDNVGLKGMRRQQALATAAQERPQPPGGGTTPAPSQPADDRSPSSAEEDPELAAYNRGWPSWPPRAPRPGATESPSSSGARSEAAHPARPARRAVPLPADGQHRRRADHPAVLLHGAALCGVGGFKVELAIFGVGHGYLYIVYLITAGFLALKARLHIPWILLMFVAGLVPGVTFVVEWLVVTRKIQPLMAAQAGRDEAGVSPAAR